MLLGVTGSGKTFTMAKVIEATQRPALILAPNKTLAAQLYGEFKSFFPDNAVEYFVSYYDYYQPEAYVPRTDTYIEKESSINEQIDRMRHSATRALLERDDVIIVASVSCIYGIGSVETYTAMTFSLKVGEKIDQRQLIADLVALQYKRIQRAISRAALSACAATSIELFPAHYEDRAWRIGFFGDEIETIVEFDPLTGKKTQRPRIREGLRQLALRDAAPDAAAGDQGHQGGAEAAPRRAPPAGPPARGAAARAAHHVRPRDAGGDRLLRRHRELFALSHRPPPGRAAADPVRISARQRARLHRREPRHVPQIGGMYRGDFRRKATLAEYGFRLPSCMDNRPLRFEEWDAMRPQTVHVSATPGDWEMEQHRRRLRRAGHPPDRADRSAGRDPPRPQRRSTTSSAR